MSPKPKAPTAITTRLREISTYFNDPNEKELCRIVLSKTHSEKERSDAIDALGFLGAAVALRPLLSVLKSESSLLAWRAANAVGAIRNKRAVPPLLEILRDAKGTQNRRAAIHALGLLGDQRAASPLIRILRSGVEPTDIRADAAEALGTCEGREARGALKRALSDDEPRVRLFAANALASCGDRQSIESLKRLLVDDSILAPFGSLADEARSAIKSIRQRLATEAQKGKKRSSLMT